MIKETRFGAYVYAGAARGTDAYAEADSLGRLEVERTPLSPNPYRPVEVDPVVHIIELHSVAGVSSTPRHGTVARNGSRGERRFHVVAPWTRRASASSMPSSATTLAEHGRALRALGGARPRHPQAARDRRHAVHHPRARRRRSARRTPRPGALLGLAELLQPPEPASSVPRKHPECMVIAATDLAGPPTGWQRGARRVIGSQFCASITDSWSGVSYVARSTTATSPRRSSGGSCRSRGSKR